MEKNIEVFSKKIAAGRRTYFVDVKESVNHEKYLVITESIKKDDNHIHNRVMVFSENIVEFAKALDEAFTFMV